MTPGFAGVKLYLSLPLTRSFLTLGAWMSVKVSRRGGGRASFRLLSRPMLILSTAVVSAWNLPKARRMSEESSLMGWPTGSRSFNTAAEHVAFPP